jgi:hypothetical protein
MNAMARGKSRMGASGGTADRVLVENVNHPGRSTSVNRPRYEAMRQAMIAALPRRAPGLSYDEMVDAVRPHLPESLFPGGDKAGWWAKTVQLDLEAKGLIARRGKPARWRLASD